MHESLQFDAGRAGRWDAPSVETLSFPVGVPAPARPRPGGMDLRIRTRSAAAGDEDAPDGDPEGPPDGTNPPGVFVAYSENAVPDWPHLVQEPLVLREPAIALDAFLDPALGAPSAGGISLAAFVPEPLGQEGAAALGIDWLGARQPAAGAPPALLHLRAREFLFPSHSAARMPIGLALDPGLDFGGFSVRRVLAATVMDELRRMGDGERDKAGLREDVVWFLDVCPYTGDAYDVFRCMLDVSAGPTIRHKIRSLLGWAESFDGGRYEAIVAYYCAYHLHRRGSYDLCFILARDKAADFPDLADRFTMLQVLCWVQKRELPRAESLLAAFIEHFPGSELLPQAEFLRGWIALQDGRTAEALKILRSVSDRFPGTDAGAKAERICENVAARF